MVSILPTACLPKVGRLLALRAPEKLKHNVPANWQIVRFDADTPVPELAAYLSSCSHLLTTISPLSGLDPVLACHEEEIADFTGWSGYVSATSSIS